MYDLFIELAGVPEEVFADSFVLQEWFSVGCIAIIVIFLVMFFWFMLSVFRCFSGGGKR